MGMIRLGCSGWDYRDWADVFYRSEDESRLPDWKRAAPERRFCKHIGALILALPEDAAGKVLEDIKRQRWEFSQYTGRSQII